MYARFKLFIKFMPDNIQDLDLKDELIVGRKVGFFKKPDDMPPMTYKIITNIDKFI